MRTRAGSEHGQDAQKAQDRQHCVAMILSLERWLALTPSVPSLQAFP